MYLSSFRFATKENEEDYRWGIKRTCYDSFYPFGVLSGNGLRMLDFEPVTIFQQIQFL